MGTKQRRLASLLLWLASIAYVLWAATFIRHSTVVAIDGHRYCCLFDDAMVSMRYAWNLAHGRGLCWNPGERVQGFTSPLMVGLMALPCIFFSKSIACLVVQLYGVPTVLGVAWYTRRLCTFVAKNAWLPLFSFVSILVYYPLSYWSLMGMETGILALLMLAAIVSVLRQDTLQATVAMCLAFLARPDFLVVAALLLALFFALNRHRALVTAGLFLAFVVLVFAWQFGYYGEALPNTYTLKIVGLPFVDRIKGGANFITPFLAVSVPLIAFAMAGTSFMTSRIRFVVLSIPASLVAYQIYIGGDAWPYWRMLVSIMPIIVAAAVAGAHALFRGSFIATVAALLFGMFVSDVQFISEMVFSAKPYKSDETIDNLNTAIVLNRTLSPDATIGVEWAGTLPYYTDFRAIDFLGKTDRRIAGMRPDMSGRIRWSGMNSVPGHNKYDLNYSIGELKPDYIQTYRYGLSDTSEWIEGIYEMRVVDGLEIIVRKGAAR